MTTTERCPAQARRGSRKACGAPAKAIARLATYDVMRSPRWQMEDAPSPVCRRHAQDGAFQRARGDG